MYLNLREHAFDSDRVICLQVIIQASFKNVVVRKACIKMNTLEAWYSQKIFNNYLNV